LKIKILKDVKILHTSWNGKVKKFYFQEGQILNGIALAEDIFDSNLFIINYQKEFFELNINFFSKIH
jgi:hypothetical protein